MVHLSSFTPSDSSLREDVAIGYIYFTDKRHPLSTGSASRVYFHRHQASLKIGRWLERKEHVHHIDGNKKNNNFDNLVIVSPSEHAKIHNPLTNQGHSCPVCGKLTRNPVHCSYECLSVSSRKAVRPTREDLENLLNTIPCERIGKIYGVSGNAIKKWCRALGLKTKPRGYWMKNLYAVVPEKDIGQVS